MWRTGGPACPSSTDTRDRLSSLARVLSTAGHPFVLIPLTVGLRTRSVFWTTVIAASPTVPLLAIIARNVRRGRWSDFDVSRHEQRSGLYHAGLPLMALTILILYFLGAHPRLLRATVAGALMFAAGLFGNRWLKISMHMMSAAFCAVLLIRVWPWTAFIAVPLVAAIAWSRRWLQRHTPAEIAVGTVVGIAAGLIAAL